MIKAENCRYSVINLREGDFEVVFKFFYVNLHVLFQGFVKF